MTCAHVTLAFGWILARLRIVYASHLAQVTRLVVDGEGRAWMRRWARYDDREAEWIVLERFGAPIARITMPAAFQPNDIGPEYVVGIMTDADGVQSIHKYRIVRSGARRD